jgi:hypothetical protein
MEFLCMLMFMCFVFGILVDNVMVCIASAFIIMGLVVTDTIREQEQKRGR